MKILLLNAFVALTAVASRLPTTGLPSCRNGDVTYTGIHLEGVEAFLGIRFAEDAGGKNRFKPPLPFVPRAGSTINADNPGPACIQDKKLQSVPKISEDCLRLNIWRPNGTNHGSQLPVLVYIYGGMLGIVRMFKYSKLTLEQEALTAGPRMPFTLER